MPALFRRRSTWIAVAAIVLLGGGGVVLVNQSQAKKAQAEAAAKAPPPASPYTAIASGKADVEGGMIQVAARRAGIVKEVYVNEGDAVVQNQILARQEDDEPRLAVDRAAAAVAEARAQIKLNQVQLTTARREHARLQGLTATNFVAQQRVDQAMDRIREAEANLEALRASVATAQAGLEQARFNLEQTVIRAPANGRIARRYANPGSGASTLNVSTMFDLEPSTQRIVRAEISEGALPEVAIGQRVQMSPESDPSRIYTGAVLRRAAVFGARKLQSDDPTERTDDRVVEVVVSADQAPFLIGQRVLVKFMRGGGARSAAAPAAPQDKAAS